MGSKKYGLQDFSDQNSLRTGEDRKDKANLLLLQPNAQSCQKPPRTASLWRQSWTTAWWASSSVATAICWRATIPPNAFSATGRAWLHGARFLKNKRQSKIIWISKTRFLGSFLSLPWLRGERQGVAGGRNGAVRVPALCAQDSQQPANHVSVWPGLRASRRAHGCDLHRRPLESISATKVYIEHLSFGAEPIFISSYIAGVKRIFTPPPQPSGWPDRQSCIRRPTRRAWRRGFCAWSRTDFCN